MDARGESPLCLVLLAARGCGCERGRGVDQDSARQAWQPPGNAETMRRHDNASSVFGRGKSRWIGDRGGSRE